MRLTRTALLAAVALLAAPLAFAQVPQKATITATGSAAQICTLGAPQVNVGAATNVQSVSGSTVMLSDLADDNSFSTKATDFTATFAAMCNFNHKLTVSSDYNGLWLVGGIGTHPGFADAVPYQATFSWGGQNGSLTATAASESEVDSPIDVNQPAAGNIVIHFEVDQGATNGGNGVPLVAGTYQDILFVTLGAQ
ncbi:MAG: hypothetical protein WBQ17_03375 [Rhizomicrobium sp.]|jgi:hypothetical protein